MLKYSTQKDQNQSKAHKISKISVVLKKSTAVENFNSYSEAN